MPPVDQDIVATIWVLDDPRWRVDDSRPSRAFTVCPRDGVTPGQLTDLTDLSATDGTSDASALGTLTAS